jgi:hypothetical protein
MTLMLLYATDPANYQHDSNDLPTSAFSRSLLCGSMDLIVSKTIIIHKVAD